MKLQTKPRTCNLHDKTEYTQLNWLELFGFIAEDGDTKALNELHEHRVFLSPKSHTKTMHIPQYIEMLTHNSIARRLCDNDPMLLEKAFDLTLDKFFNMPLNRNGSYVSKPHGPDCRYYFKGFIEYATKRLEDIPEVNAIELEIILAKLFQKFITMHFYLSCQEVKRRDSKLVRRYKLQINGYPLYLWISVTIPGNRCRQWLFENIGKIDPNRPGEQDRVQSLINKLQASRRIYSLNQLLLTSEQIPAYNDTHKSMLEREISVNGLAETVACEKEENFEFQRPAIRALGPDKLKELIHTIFSKLSSGNYVEKDIACFFGLSFSTLSRFAGSQWKNHCNDNASAIPDLWRNTAMTLAGNDDFIIAAKKAGVLKRIREILKTTI